MTPGKRVDPMRVKKQFNSRLTKLARGLLERIANARAISNSDVVELLIREEAERVGMIEHSKGVPRIVP